MRNIKLKSLLSLVLVLILLASTATYATQSPGSYSFDKNPNFSITYIAYYVDSSVSEYTNYVGAAFRSWQDATSGNNINARVGYVKAPSLGFSYYPYTPHVVFKKSTTGKSYVTYFDQYGSPANSGTGEPFSNWSKCVVYLAPNLSSPNFTITHEIGHVLGLIHPNQALPGGMYQGQATCMLPSDVTGSYANSRRPYPTPFDASNLNSRFK